MMRRYSQKDAYKSLLRPALFYLFSAFILFYLCKPYLPSVNDEVLISLAVIGIWRYSFMFLNYLRAGIYALKVYPRYLAKIQKLTDKQKYPKHLYFVIPSYKEESWVSVEVFQSILADINTLPCQTTLVVSTGSDFEDGVISNVYNSHPNKKNVKLIFQRQSRGKRIAMGHALRSVARLYNEYIEEDSLTIFMDGDTYLPLGTLQKSLPFFALNKNLGAVTTNEVAYINSKSNLYKDWFNLKFAQRHILFQSQSLSKRVLTLTGRFSIFRTSAVVTEDFISNIENDIIIDPLYGKFRFLMGDDKSSWYNLMKHGWEMLYLPDVLVYSLESRDGNFFEISKTLPYRWYGNTLRNNARARKLKNQPLFIKYLFYDQLAQMWTSLVGIVAALLLSIFVNIVYLPLYFSWIFVVRIFQMSVFVYSGHPISMRTLPLMLYTQWVGGYVKLKAYFYLSDQKWAKGDTEMQTANQDIDAIKVPKAHYLSPFRMYLFILIFIFFLLTLYTKIVSLPEGKLLAGKIEKSNIVFLNVMTDDNKDDAKALNALIRSVSDNSIIMLPSGVLDIYEPIIIKRSNISIKGNNTILLSHIQGKDKAVVTIEGMRGHYIGKTVESMQDKIHLKIQIKENLHKKELLLIEQKNDKHFVYDVLGSKKWYKKFPKLRSEIVEVAAFRDSVLTMPFYSKSMIDAKASIYTIKKVSNVTIRDITIDSIYKSKKYNYVYENSEPNIMVNGIKLLYVSHIVLKNIQIYNSGSSPLVLQRAYACTLQDINIDGAINKGKKGNGYLRINKSFHNNFSNISVKHIRHITFQWSSAYNKIDGLYSEVDVNFHGGSTHDNEVLNAVFNVDVKKHKWGSVFITPENASWAPPDFKTNIVKEKL